MATISANAYNDAAARSAGEAMTINSGAVWTVRTDYRVHANAPASNLGSLAALTPTEGEILWDSRNIRWMAYNTGTGNVPAIGTTISRNGVSGYLLGVWSAINVAQTAVGAAMPVSGFIKFREVTNGPFAAGALTGIGASATGPDVQGWMELPHDAAADFTVGRLGKHTARGGRFFLANTTGVRGQSFQIPTMGSAVMFAPGLMVETGVGTNEYEFWPGLNGASNGWSHVHVGNATGTTDRRQSFLLSNAGGAMIMGATWSVSATYASLAAQASTHAEITHSCTYTWINNVVEVYYATGHLLETGQQTGLDFTSGGATANDGIYTVTVLSPYHFTVPLAGSGTGGNVTSKPGIQISFTAHAMNIGESVYCDFTTGTPVDGTYEIYAVPASGTYNIKYPHVAALTSGAVSVLHTLVITYAGHGLAVGQTVYCDFTSGGATIDGVYVVKTAATTFNINYPHSAAITTSNVTLSRDIGYVPEAGRRTWIPSNILTEVATGARATNTAPNATIGSRPEWVTTAAGAIDLEYVYGCSGYPNFNQSYSMRLRDCIFFDRTFIGECATALDVDGLNLGMHGALDTITFEAANNYAGGTVSNVKAMRGNTPGTGDHAFALSYNKGITFNNVQAAIVQYAISTGVFNISANSLLQFNNCRVLNANIYLAISTDITFTGLDYNERLNGNGLAALNMFNASAGCHRFKVENPTFGFGGTVPNQLPRAIVAPTGCDGWKLRNVGTLSSPIPLPTWARNLTSMAYITYSSGSNSNYKVQKVFVEGVRTNPFSPTNSDKGALYESIRCGFYIWSSRGLMSIGCPDLDAEYKNIQEIVTSTGQSSVYGSHFHDAFLGSNYGRYSLLCNEPSAATASQFTSVVGTAKFNSSQGVIIPTINNQHYWTDPNFRKGHTGFVSTVPVMQGGTITNYAIHYQIDLGSGFSGWRNMYYQRAGGSGSSAAYTFTVTDATGVEIGDRCWGTGLANNQPGLAGSDVPRVTNVAGNTITVNLANTGTVSGTITFGHLPEETVDPAIGFRIRIRVTTIATATAAITKIQFDTKSTAAAQANYYPLDTNTLTFLGLPVGTEIRIRQGSYTIEQQQDVTTGSYVFTHSLAGKKIKAQFTLPGYDFTDIEWELTATNVSTLVNYEPDPSYV